MKTHTNIIIPSDIQGESQFKQHLEEDLSKCRRWFDRPAYYGTIAQVNDGHLDEKKKEDIE